MRPSSSLFSLWSFFLFFLFFLAAASPIIEIRAPSTDNASSTITRSAANPFAFEYLVTTRLQELRRIWTDLKPWAIHVTTFQNTPSTDLGQFKKIVFTGLDANRNQLIINENINGRPTIWLMPQVQRPTPDMRISTWTWSSPRKTLTEAWDILREATLVPIIRIILMQFENGPPWGPHDQQYYLFYPDNNIEHVLKVGAHDGVFYGTGVEGDKAMMLMLNAADRLVNADRGLPDVTHGVVNATANVASA